MAPIAEVNGKRLGNASAVAVYAEEHLIQPAALEARLADPFIQLLAHLSNGPLGTTFKPLSHLCCVWSSHL